MNLSPDIMNALVQWGPLVVVMGVFYFVLLRPHRKEQQKRAQMLGSLKKSDRVVTIGGMLGTITALTEKTVTLKVADKVEIEFSRDAVSRYQNPHKNEAVKNAKPEKGDKPAAKNGAKNADKPAEKSPEKPAELTANAVENQEKTDNQ